MKVLMLSSNTASSPYPAYPLGCCIVASSLERNGHAVRVLDMLQMEGSLERLACELRSSPPDTVGISIRNIDNVNMLDQETFLEMPTKIVRTVREVVPGALVVLGGPAFSIMPEQILERTGADFGVTGEGEQAFPELVRLIENGVKVPQRIIRAPQDLEGSLISGDTYRHGLVPFYSGQGSILPLQTKRGCSNNCVYCTYPHIEGKVIRAREPGDVVADMIGLKKNHNADFIFFTDSVFNDSEGRYLELVGELEKNNPGIPWTAFFQPDPRLDSQTVARLVDCGLQSVELGPDATSDTTLRQMGKKFSFAEVLRCNMLFAERNIAVANYFMMGGPGETEDTAREGVENIRKLGMSVSFVFLGVRIFPGTPLFLTATSQNIISADTDLTAPVYYFSPGIDRGWLEEFLQSTLPLIRHCVYPPNAMDEGIKILRSMGYRGNLWDMMVKGSRRIPKRCGPKSPEP